MQEQAAQLRLLPTLLLGGPIGQASWVQLRRLGTPPGQAQPVCMRRSWTVHVPVLCSGPAELACCAI